MSPTLIALLCFAVAAVAGLTAAYHVFSGRMPPWGLTALHGLFGASGLALLAYAVLIGGATGLTLYALIALLVAALGGFFLVSFHFRGAAHPKPVVVIHAGVAVIGVATLVLALI
jgi:hypothetical protein